ncbi:hypothetical protein II906_12860 [bacterium]|nr:hypothetical protein [bacterium]
MKIQSTQISYNNIPKTPCKKSSLNSNSQAMQEDFCAYNAENLKANFITFKGNFRILEDVVLYDKVEKKYVKASMQMREDGNLEEYQIIKGNDKLGYMYMNPKAEIIEEISNETRYGLKDTDKIAKIAKLRSIEGDRYSGIGTQFVKKAIERSLSLGQMGAVGVTACRYFDTAASDYRKNDSPIPFYYKMGFKAADSVINDAINIALDFNMQDLFPRCAFLVLTPKNVRNFYDYYENKFPLEASDIE